MSLANPAFSLLPCPLSPSPFPNGEGEIYGYFMQGAPPLASPAFNRLRHLQSLPYRYPHGVAGFFTTRIPDAQREPTLLQSKEPAPAGRVVRPHFPVPPGFSPRGCKGRSPLHKKTKNLPLPRRGRGQGGCGRQSKLKAGQAGDKEGKPPRRGRQGQVERPQEGKCVNYPSNRNSSI